MTVCISIGAGSAADSGHVGGRGGGVVGLLTSTHQSAAALQASPSTQHQVAISMAAN